MDGKRGYLVISIPLLIISILSSCRDDPNENPNEREGVPWGAMYTPNEFLTYMSMSGTVTYYRGASQVVRLLADLLQAQEKRVQIILTLGSVAPLDYLDSQHHIDMTKVHTELDPFFAAADSLTPFIQNGTVWGIRFLDEPHDPGGLPAGFEIDPLEVGQAFSLIKSYFPETRAGTTSPPSYLNRVPGADFAFFGYNHGHPQPGVSDPLQLFVQQSDLAQAYGLDLVANLNANRNPAGNREFFELFNRICGLEGVDFVTAWQWPQADYPYPCFQTRLNDPDPAVQALIAQIPISCRRQR